MSEVKIVAIDKVFWKAKMKDWDYISAINVGIMCRMISISNALLITNKKTNGEQFPIAFHLQISFRIQIMRSKNPLLTIIHNKLKI